MYELVAHVALSAWQHDEVHSSGLHIFAFPGTSAAFAIATELKNSKKRNFSFIQQILIYNFNIKIECKYLKIMRTFSI